LDTHILTIQRYTHTYTHHPEIHTPPRDTDTPYQRYTHTPPRDTHTHHPETHTPTPPDWNVLHTDPQAHECPHCLPHTFVPHMLRLTESCVC